MLCDTKPSIGFSFWTWDLFHPRVSTVVNTLFSRTLFHCCGSIVLYLFGHIIVGDDRFCTGILKCLLSLRLFDEAGIKQCSTLPWCSRYLQVDLQGMFWCLVTLVYVPNLIHSIMYHFRRSGYSSTSWSLLSASLSIASLTDPDFSNFPFLPVLSLTANVLCTSAATSLYL